jgi:hypothetical protein
MRRVSLIVLLTAAGAGRLLGAGTASADPIPKPLVGVQVNDDGSVCAGFSYQMSVCTPATD